MEHPHLQGNFLFSQETELKPYQVLGQQNQEVRKISEGAEETKERSRMKRNTLLISQKPEVINNPKWKKLATSHPQMRQLHFKATEKTTDASLANLSHTLKSFSSVRHLNVDFGLIFCYMPAVNPTNDGLRYLSQGLKSCVPLQKISFAFLRGRSVLTDQSIKYLSQSLKYQCFLESVDIEFAYMHMTNEGLKRLSLGLSRLPLLRKICLDLQSVEEGGVKCLIEGLKPLHDRLQILNIKFNSEIDDAELKSVSDALEPFYALENIVFYFFNSKKLTDTGLEYLSAGWKSLRSVKSITFNLGCCEELVFREGFKTFCANLRLLNSLKSICLYLHFCPNINDGSVEYLTKGLESVCRALESISLNFYSSPITDASVKSLSSALKLVQSLQYLRLGLSSCSITNSGVESLSEALQSLQRLKAIDIRFDQCQQIDDQVFNYLSKSLKSFDSLTDLALGFSDLTSITDKGFEDLKSGLESLNSLQTIALDFRGCLNITDDGLRYIMEGLKTSHSMKQIGFKFCKGITNVGIRHVSETLKSFGALHTISLDFGGAQVAVQDIEELTRELQAISSLNSIDFNDEPIKSSMQTATFHCRKGLKLSKSVGKMTIS